MPPKRPRAAETEELITRWQELNRQRQQARDTVRQLGKELKATERELVEHMNECGETTLQLENGTVLSVYSALFTGKPKE
jgi:chromosome segregation ATPase